jgi:hypothetical protein
LYERLDSLVTVVLTVVVGGKKLITVFGGREESIWAAVLGEFGRRE